MSGSKPKNTEFLRVRLFGFGHRQHLVGQFGIRFSAESQFGGVQVDAGHEVGDLLRGELSDRSKPMSRHPPSTACRARRVASATSFHRDGFVDAPAVVAPIPPDVGGIRRFLPKYFDSLRGLRPGSTGGH